MNLQDVSSDALGILVAVAPLTYIGLLIFCAGIVLFKPGKNLSRNILGWRHILDINRENLRIWGYAGGIVVFLILLVLHKMGAIEVSPIDFVGGRLFVGMGLGFGLGVLALEAARLTEMVVFASLFVGVVVAGSLSSFYVFWIFEDIRAILVLATMSFLLGVIVDFILRHGLGRIRSNGKASAKSDWE